MSSLSGSGYSTADSIYTGGIIAAIVISSVVGFAIVAGFIFCIYCLCCQTSKRYPGAVVQPGPHPEAYNPAPPYAAPPAYYQPMNRY